MRQINDLSHQRQIIAATFNVQRDRKTAGADKTREGAVVVGLMQKRLREQVNELLTNFAGRVGPQDERFKKITEFLKQSVPEMQAAETKLAAASRTRREINTVFPDVFAPGRAGGRSG